MKGYITLALLMMISCRLVWAQGENNIWSFGRMYSLDFNSNPPLLNDTVTLTNPPTYAVNSVKGYKQSIVVCNAAGQMQFMVKLLQGSTMPGSAVNATTPIIFDRDGQPIPGTHMMNNMEPTAQPVVIPHPANSSQYYIFYVRNAGLLYSLFDMTLNNGLGHIVPGQHNIVISNYNSVQGNTLTAVKGCTGVWLLVRSREEAEFKSFLVDQSGINLTPVVSEYDGTLADLVTLQSGCMLRASPDSKLLALASVGGGIYGYPGGLELYDFESCSGKVKNARLLDSGDDWYYGVCFSPDNSKLYATRNDFFFNPAYSQMKIGKVFQYDLDQNSVPDIIASKTLILENPTFLRPPFCVVNSAELGDMRTGPDARIYLLNNQPGSCAGPGMAFHIIDQPNNPGLSCSPQLNTIYNTINHMVGDGWPDYNQLSREIVSAPLPPDTVPGQTFNIVPCFKDSFTLIAQYNNRCYRWVNGMSNQNITVYTSGSYMVSYFNDCTITVDTYNVRFIPMPQVATLQYSCAGDATIAVEQPDNDTTTYTYTLSHQGNGRQWSAVSNTGHQFENLGQEGGYDLKIEIPGHCDTTIQVQLAFYPGLEIVTSPSDTTIRYGDAIRLNATGAQLYTWWPTSPLDTAMNANPMARPIKPTLFTVLGFNEYGCTDTGFINIGIDYNMPDMVPNAFSPNGDGVNDVFRLEGATYQSVRAFQVYNRFGQRVFNTMDLTKGWDGTQNGEPCDAGIYHYLIQLDYPDGKKRAYKGDVVLMR